MFSPTIHSTANPIYNSLKYLYEVDIILDYSDHKLLEKLQEIDGEKQFIEDYKEYLTVWKKYMKIECLTTLYAHLPAETSPSLKQQHIISN